MDLDPSSLPFVMRLDAAPGYVVKTKTLVGEATKVFINVCVDPQLPLPEITDLTEITTRVIKGDDWIVPIIVSPKRQAKDKSGNPAVVFDCCMNPQVLLLAAQDPGIKVLVNETCIELVEDTTGYELDRNFSIPKMKSKGDLYPTEFSEIDFNTRPKPLEDVLQEQLKKPELPKEHMHKPKIELLESRNYTVEPFKGEWPLARAAATTTSATPAQATAQATAGTTTTETSVSSTAGYENRPPNYKITISGPINEPVPPLTTMGNLLKFNDTTITLQDFILASAAVLIDDTLQVYVWA